MRELALPWLAKQAVWPALQVVEKQDGLRLICFPSKS